MDSPLLARGLSGWPLVGSVARGFGWFVAGKNRLADWNAKPVGYWCAAVVKLGGADVHWNRTRAGGKVKARGPAVWSAEIGRVFSITKGRKYERAKKDFAVS
jgi:hypothetical protein